MFVLALEKCEKFQLYPIAWTCVGIHVLPCRGPRRNDVVRDPRGEVGLREASAPERRFHARFPHGGTSASILRLCPAEVPLSQCDALYRAECLHLLPRAHTQAGSLPCWTIPQLDLHGGQWCKCFSMISAIAVNSPSCATPEFFVVVMLLSLRER